MKFRKKPVVIEAVQIKKGMWDDPIAGWLIDEVYRGNVELVNVGLSNEHEPFAIIITLEGIMRGDAGDWIIRGVKGEIYPCKPDIFEATYELVGEEE